jgi:hypothetical protein
MRDSLFDTVMRECELESVQEVVRLKTSIPWDIMLYKLKSEIDTAHTVSLDPDLGFNFEGMEGSITFFQGLFTKGFSSGILSQRGTTMEQLMTERLITDQLPEDFMEVVPELMGNVDLESVRAMSTLVSVAETAWVTAIKPKSLNGPMTQLWLWGFITGWEFDARKALADVDL